jgi:hypothetical protein
MEMQPDFGAGKTKPIKTNFTVLSRRAGGKDGCQGGGWGKTGEKKLSKKILNGIDRYYSLRYSVDYGRQVF